MWAARVASTARFGAAATWPRASDYVTWAAETYGLPPPNARARLAAGLRAAGGVALVALLRTGGGADAADAADVAERLVRAHWAAITSHGMCVT